VNRPATSTHKWWAKRLGTVFRAIITAAVTADNDDALRTYESAAGLEGLVVLDPFAGSGVTSVEAVKLGARAISFDINPVATLVQRQALQSWDWQRLAAAYKAVEASCRAEIDRVHSTEDGRTVLYYFWVAGVACPHCSEHTRLFDSPVFSKHAYPRRVPRAQIVCPTCLDIQEGRYDFAEATCSNGHRVEARGAVRGATAQCPTGHTFKVLDALNGSPPGREMFAKLVVDDKGRKTYEPVSEWDRDLFVECERALTALPSDAVLPHGRLSPGNNTNQALRWNFREWRDFFNARQLYSLALLGGAIRALPDGPEREALATLFSGTLEFNNLFTSFKGEGTGAVRHMFSHHILKPERTPLEAHPWGTPQSSGSFSTLFESRLRRAHNYKQEPFDLVLENGEVQRTFGLGRPIHGRPATSWSDFVETRAAAYVATQNSAATDLPDASVDLVVSDPPFMDNVHYAELADFFHAWLLQIVPHPAYPRQTTTRQRGEVQNADPAEFGHAIEAVWSECERVLKPGGLLAFTFHQARLSGWVELIAALTRAGFVVTSVQPVKGEMSTSVVKSGAREPSNLDSIVVCRRQADGPVSLHSTIEAACAAAEKSLAELQQAGVEVGAGDVRSVVRGTALAFLARQHHNLTEQQAQVADDLASHAVERHRALSPVS
jgi:adenine-specific DNA methylase